MIEKKCNGNLLATAIDALGSGLFMPHLAHSKSHNSKFEIKMKMKMLDRQKRLKISKS